MRVATGDKLFLFFVGYELISYHLSPLITPINNNKKQMLELLNIQRTEIRRL